jgi:hypothetical protein
MTRTYFAKRLLEHGPLSFAQFREVTGWPEDACEAALRGLVETGIACFTQEAGNRRRVYRLLEAA